MFVFETESCYVARSGLELNYLREITGVDHYVQLSILN